MPRYRPNVIMTDEQVLRMRREIRRTGQFCFRQWAREFGVSHVTARKAAIGLTFRNLPDAITEKLHTASKGGRIPSVDYDELCKLYALRQKDVNRWTYQALADIASINTRKTIYPSNIKRLFAKFFGEVQRTISNTPRANSDSQRVVRLKPKRVGEAKPRTQKPLRHYPAPEKVMPANVVVLDIDSARGRKTLAERLLEMRAANY